MYKVVKIENIEFSENLLNSYAIPETAISFEKIADLKSLPMSDYAALEVDDDGKIVEIQSLYSLLYKKDRYEFPYGVIVPYYRSEENKSIFTLAVDMKEIIKVRDEGYKNPTYDTDELCKFVGNIYPLNEEETLLLCVFKNDRKMERIDRFIENSYTCGHVKLHGYLPLMFADEILTHVANNDRRVSLISGYDFVKKNVVMNNIMVSLHEVATSYLSPYKLKGEYAAEKAKDVEIAEIYSAHGIKFINRIITGLEPVIRKDVSVYMTEGTNYIYNNPLDIYKEHGVHAMVYPVDAIDGRYHADVINGVPAHVYIKHLIQTASLEQGSMWVVPSETNRIVHMAPMNINEENCLGIENVSMIVRDRSNIALIERVKDIFLSGKSIYLVSYSVIDGMKICKVAVEYPRDLFIHDILQPISRAIVGYLKDQNPSGEIPLFKSDYDNIVRLQSLQDGVVNDMSSDIIEIVDTERINDIFNMAVKKPIVKIYNRVDNILEWDLI